MATKSLYQKLVFALHALSFFLRFLSDYILLRLQEDEKKNNMEFQETETKSVEFELETEFRDFGEEDAEEEEKQPEPEPEPDMVLKFKFRTYEEFREIQKETAGDDAITREEEVVPCAIEIEKGKEITVSEEERVIEKIEITEKPEDKEEQQQQPEAILVNPEEKHENSVVSDSESGSGSGSGSDTDFEMKLQSGGFLSDSDFDFDLEQVSESFDENDFDFDDDDDGGLAMEEELKKLEHGDDSNPDFLSDKDFKDEKSSNENELETLWEHQELIEQLKMELKKVKATGLPTILEESESPKIADDLKPWKIDEFKREDCCIGELHKFYKSYRERMRKFDIMNYQKMYAMGFLQLKDPLQSISKQKRSPPTLKSLVSQNLWLFKHRIHGSDPMKKFIAELQGDLEVVYVGQMCLSWEFLHWQYEKAWDLWDSDPRGRRRYNEVAGEFQQFQVLVQRFVEDETFQGPRVQNYVKSRCAVRNLLQVPVIREDNMKGKRKAMKLDVDEYVITSDMLVEIVEESIRIFWRYVRADKDCAVASVNSNRKAPELLEAEDLNLYSEIKKALQKKEKKLKDVLRSENCILRKFRRSSEDDSDQVLYFFSQVDMKLVARVLNMSKITRDQLIWCHNKLSRISFVNRKIQVEPAFLLFPN